MLNQTKPRREWKPSSGIAFCGQSASNLTSADRILIHDSAQIQKLRTESTWKKVLENEETAKKIQDILQAMDKSLATFQV